MIFRFSQKLAKKIKEKPPLPAKPLSINPYIDWSCHLFTARRCQFILLCNTPTLFTSMLHGAGITDSNRFLKRAMEAIRDSFEDEKLDLIYQEQIIPSTGSISFAKALDRRTTGCMNEQIKYAKWILEDEELAPYQVAAKLNKYLLSTPTGYEEPREALHKLNPEPPLPSNVLKFERRR